MRDRRGQAGDGRRRRARADRLVEWPDGDGRAAVERSRRPQPLDDVEPDTCERITLIEFLWMAPTGEQPVIFVSRELLQ